MEMLFENVDADGRRADERYLAILQAHLWAFGAGELKRDTVIRVIWNFKPYYVRPVVKV